MEFNEFYTAWAEIAERFGLAEFATEELSAKLKILYEELDEVGSHMNLTAIRDFEGVLTKHFADSLSVAHLIPKNASVIDVGCGAGFPSLPLAIARPDISVIRISVMGEPVSTPLWVRSARCPSISRCQWRPSVSS